jgi:hypothetical protein
MPVPAAPLASTGGMAAASDAVPSMAVVSAAPVSAAVAFSSLPLLQAASDNARAAMPAEVQSFPI